MVILFSLIFLLITRFNIFIDPLGGQLKKFFTIWRYYLDYAKIYQSLIGYDFHLLNFVPQKNHNLICAFEEIFIEKFSKDYLDYLKIITASLFNFNNFHKKSYQLNFINTFMN